MTFKSYLSGFLRKTHLLPLAEKIRFTVQKLKYSEINRAFKQEHTDICLPPEFFIYETYRLNFREYYYDGKESANEIVELISNHYSLAYPGTKLLDWGCGPGRVVRHLPGLLPHAEIYATDYNENYIRWCSKNLPGIKFSVNDINPPLAYPSSYFDVVIGLSIFTHLSAEGHENWIQELARVMKPRGLLLITTQGQPYRPRLTMAEKKLFDNGQLVTRRYINEGNRLYSSFQPRGFIEKLITEKFSIADFIPGNVGNGDPSQDSWLLIRL